MKLHEKAMRINLRREMVRMTHLRAGETPS
jgi:hypothetical protein